jgi:hypothetical protein
MLLTHFHLIGRDAPMRLMPVEIKLDPLGMPKFAGANEQQRCQLQRISCDHVTGIPVNRTKQLADTGRLSDGGVMLGYDRRKCPTKVSSYVPLCTFGLNGVPEHLTATLAGPVRSFVGTPAFDTLEHFEHIRRAQLGDGT